MARYGDNAIDEVRQRADIVEIIGAHVRLRRAGRNFVGLCPFHNEKTPSFSVNAERGFYHCFGCGAGGTVFNFIMKVEGLSFPEAIRSLATRYGVSLPELKNDGPGAAEREALAKANQTAAEFYAHVLWNTPDGEQAREYLRSRGITVETARAFMLGFSPARPASLAKALEKRGLTEAGIKAGVVKRDEMGLHDAFRARVMFPIRDAQGKVIAFGGRVLDARMPKYLNSPESPAYSKTRTLYGLHEARASDRIAGSGHHRRGLLRCDRVVASRFPRDRRELRHFTDCRAVAAALAIHEKCFRMFRRRRRGRKASLRALEIFLQAGLLGRGIFIPTGFDPDTLVRERGAAFFEEFIGASELLVDYFLKEQAREAKGSLSGRARAAEKVAELLKLVAQSLRIRSVRAQGVGAARRRRGHSAQGRARGGPPSRRRVAGRDWCPISRAATRPHRLNSACLRSRCCIPSIARGAVQSFAHPIFSPMSELATMFAEACALGEALRRFRGIYRRATVRGATGTHRGDGRGSAGGRSG